MQRKTSASSGSRILLSCLITLRAASMASLCSGSRSLLESNASNFPMHTLYCFFFLIEVLSFFLRIGKMPCRRAHFPTWRDLEPTTQPTVWYERAASDSFTAICITDRDVVLVKSGRLARDAR